MSSKSRRLAMLALAAVLPALASLTPACNFTKKPMDHPRVALAPARDPAAVEAAILKALENRGWTAQKESPGSLLATIDRRTHRVVARITYSGTAFQVDYVSSINMDYEKGAGGESIHRNYNGWIANVVRDTQAYLEGRKPDGGLLEQGS